MISSERWPGCATMCARSFSLSGPRSTRRRDGVPVGAVALGRRDQLLCASDAPLDEQQSDLVEDVVEGFRGM
jgi:hypothetical protein